MPFLRQSLTVKFAYNYLEKVVLSSCSLEVKLVRIPLLTVT